MRNTNYLDCLETDGYCVIEGLLDEQFSAAMDAEARAAMAEGTRYVKYEGALARFPQLAPPCTDPAVASIAQVLLGEPYYIANNIAFMWCQPGSSEGGLHCDWPLGGVPEPYPPWPMLLQTMWMLTDFTEENGATRVVPGSHLSGRAPGPGDHAGEIAVVGKRGSVLVWHGGLWHRNGANTSCSQHRMGANIAYIPQFVHRPRHMWPLVDGPAASGFSPELRKLLERSLE